MSNLNFIKPQNVQGIINKYCLTIGMIPSSYKLSLTYEEQILAIGKYLEETVYPAINNNAEALAELQESFALLKNYVENYLDNIDIQEDVNNKLDEMVEDGTLGEIINQEIFGELNDKIENEVKYHFIKTGELKGDCVLIQTKNHCFLYDLSASTNYQDITNYLNLHGITHIDGIIISHFHHDHIGGTGAEGFIGLINSDFVNDTTQIYLPTTPDFTRFINDTATQASDVVGRVTAMMNAVINASNLRGLTINYMSTNNTLEFDNVIFRFLNCSEEQYNNYYNITQTFDEGLHYCTTYNNFSMVLEIYNLNNTCLLTGDIEEKAEEILAPFINRNITLKKIEHHGVNQLSNDKYLFKTNSDINVVMNGTEDSQMTTMRACYGFIFLTGKKLYSTIENSSMIFIDNGNNVISYQNLIQKILPTMSIISGLTGINAGGIKNLNLSSYKNVIKQNDDLNDFTIPGDYCCFNTDIASTILNKPNQPYAFKLTVEQTTNVERILQRIVFNIDQYMEYVRYYSGSWSQWERVKTSEFAMAKASENVTISDTDYHNIPFDNLEVNTENFSLVDNGIKCNKAGYYIINAQTCFGGSSILPNDRVILAIAKNDQNQFLAQQDVSNTQQTLNINGYIMYLSLGDIITAKYRNYTSGRGILISAQSLLSIHS